MPDPWEYYRAPTTRPNNPRQPSIAEAFYARIAREAQERDRRDLQRKAVVRYDDNPDKRAQARRIGRDMGVPAPVVGADIPGYQAQQQRSQVADAARGDPRLGRWLGNNAEIAGDDISSMLFLRDSADRYTSKYDLTSTEAILRRIGLPTTREEMIDRTFRPMDLPRKDREEIRSRARTPDEYRRLVSAAVIRQEAPTDAEWAQANRDNEAERRMERGVWGQIAGSLRAGTAMASGGLFGSIANVAGVVGADDFERLMLDVQGVTSDYADKNRGMSTSFIADSLYSGVESIPISVGAVLTRDPIAAGSLFYTTTAGNSYAEARNAGLGVNRASQYAFLNGSIEVATEYMPTSRLIDLADGTGAVSKGIKRFLVGEALGEQAATHLQDLTTWAYINPDQTFADYLAARPEATARTFLATVAAAGPQVAISTGIGRALRTEARIEGSGNRLDALDDLMESSAGSRIRERDPAAFRQLMDSLAGDGEHIYIPASSILALKQDYADDEFWGDYASDITDALATGGDVAIPLSDVVARLADHEDWQAISSDVRVGEKGMSRNEIDEANAALNDLKFEAGDKLDQADRKARREAAPGDRLRASVRDRLMNTGMSPEEASANAEITASLFETEAANLGREITGNEFAENVRVQRVLPELLSRPEAADTLDMVINAMRNGGDPNIGVGPSLLDFISQRGGVNDTGGDLASMGLPSRLIRDFDPQQASIDGLTGQGDYGLDSTFRAAIEYGFFPELSQLENQPGPSELDTQTLLDAIGRELGGQKVYAETREDQMRAAGVELREVLADAGVDPDTASNEEIRKTVDAFENEQRQEFNQLGEVIDIDGVNRPTQNSEGQQLAATEEGVRAFWRWFGDSKVVDAQGRPLVVHHGTDAEFEAFDHNKIGSNATALGYGFYFAERENVAKAYKSEGGSVMPAYLALSNPVDENASIDQSQAEDLVRKAVELEIQQYQDEIEDYRDSFMSNVVDTYSTDEASAVREVASVLAENENIPDAIAELANIMGGKELALRAAVGGIGVDGIHIPDFQEGDGQVWVAFDPKQIKSVNNRGTFDPNDARILEQSQHFFSALERAAEGIKTNRAPAQQWIATLKKSPGVKQEELDWTGIIDWLEIQEGPVEKDAVLQVIRNGGIDVSELELAVLTEEDLDPSHIEERIQDEEGEFFYNYRPRYSVHEYEVEEDGKTRTVYAVESNYGTLSEHDDQQEAIDALDEANHKQEEEEYSDWYEEQRKQVVEDMLEGEASYGYNRVKWQQFSLSERGSEAEKKSYRELLITLPPGSMNNPDEVFEGTHFDEHEHEGIIAHSRFFDAKGPNGEKILFLDEIQSDWHQEGKKHGYNVAPSPADVEAARKERDAAEEEYDVADERLREIAAPAVMRARKNSTEAGIGEGDERVSSLHALNYARSEEGQANAEIAAALERYEQANDDFGYARRLVSVVERGVNPEAYKKSFTAFREAEDAALKMREKAATAFLVLREKLKPLLHRRMAELEAEFRRDVEQNGIEFKERHLDATIRAERNHLFADAVEGEELTPSAMQGIVYSANFLLAEEKKKGGSDADEVKDALELADIWMQRIKQAESNVRLRQQEFSNAGEGGLIPDAPFKDTWPALVMKRMTAWAAEGGYDQIAWIKQGENNGGTTHDDVEWFYGRNLPNMTNKFLKPYGAKVKPVRVEGREAVPVARIAEIDAEIAKIKELPGGTQRQEIYGDDAKEAAREKYKRSVKATEDGVRRDREVNIPFHQKSIRDIEAAMERGDKRVRLEGSSYDVGATKDEIALHERRIREAEDRISKVEKLLDATSDFDEIWERSRKVAALTAERKELSRTGPTNLGFEINDELRKAASKGFALYQAGKAEPQGSISGGLISGTDGPAIIKLFESANFSTFQHEMAHFWLERFKGNALSSIDTDGNAAARQTFADWGTLKAWFAKEGHPIGDDGVIPVAAHELFARSWERYLMEGKSPKTSLNSVFRKFARWLSSIYRKVKNLNAPITPEVREVMDRMLATQEQIELAAQERELRLMFDDAVAAGMTEQEAKRYAALGEEARSQAEEEVYGKVFRSIRRREQKRWREQEAKVRAEVADAVGERPIFKALAMLREKDGDRLDKQWLIDNYGQDAPGMMPAGMPVYKDGGVNADQIAEMVGFNSGDQLVRELMGLEKLRRSMKESGDKRSVKKATIDQETAQEMADRFGDPMNDGTIEREASAAVQNERQGERLEMELKALATQNRRRATPYALAREWARDRIERGVISEMISGKAQYRYTRTAAKASRDAQKAFARGDAEEAFRHKQTEMLHNALAREAAEASDRVEAAVKRLGKLAKQRTVKTMAQDYLERIHGLLEGYEFKRQSQRFIDARDEYARWAQQQTEAGHDVVAVERLAQAKNWSRMTVEELTALDDAVKQLVYLGRNKQTLLDNKERREFDEVVGEAITATQALPQKPTRSQFGGETRTDLIKAGFASLHSVLVKMEDVFDLLDDDKSNGVFNRVVFKPIADAQAREHDMMNDTMGRLVQAIKDAGQPAMKRWQQRHTIDELNDVDERGRPIDRPATLLGEELLVMAMNMGNRGNMEKLIGGFGWDKQYGGMEKARAVVMDVLNSRLAAEDWQYVQTVWDTIDELWPEISALEKRVNGFSPEKVEATPIETNAGQLRGGYFPVVYDPNSKVGAKNLEVEEKGLFPSNYFRATTRAGSTRERTEFKGPLYLSLGVINRHVAEVVHDITHREVVMNADKFLSDDRIQRAMEGVVGKDVVNQMRPWLSHIANEWASDREGNSEAERFLKATRTNATVVGLGFRLSTMLLQVSGYSNSIERVGLRWVARGIRKQLTGIKAWKFAMENSKELKSRLETMDRDIRDNAKRMASRQGGILSAAQRFAFHGIGYMDRLVSVGTWLGAYDKALGQGLNEEEATYEADKAVRQSQGSGAAKDMARVQRGTGKMGEAWKLATMFYSYSSAFYQRQVKFARDTKAAVRERDVSAVPDLAARFLFLNIVPALLSEWLAGRGPDDDEDEGAWALSNILVAQFQAIPFAREIAMGIESGFGYSYTPAEGFGRSAVSVARDIGRVSEGKGTKRATRNFLEMIGYSTGKVPGQFAQSAQFLVNVGYGEEDPETAAEWWEGISKGKIED